MFHRRREYRDGSPPPSVFHLMSSSPAHSPPPLPTPLSSTTPPPSPPSSPTPPPSFPVKPNTFTSTPNSLFHVVHEIKRDNCQTLSCNEARERCPVLVVFPQVLPLLFEPGLMVGGVQLLQLFYFVGNRFVRDCDGLAYLRNRLRIGRRNQRQRLDEWPPDRLEKVCTPDDLLPKSDRDEFRPWGERINFHVLLPFLAYPYM